MSYDHTCEVCLEPYHLHGERCYEPGCDGAEHWPPVCCRGCGCGSWEREHPQAASLPAGEREGGQQE